MGIRTTESPFFFIYKPDSEQHGILHIISNHIERTENMSRIWRNLEKNKNLLTRAAQSHAFIVFDTETTGLKKDDQIIEIAAYKCDFKDGNFTPYDVLWFYIKPDKPIPEAITEINGISNEKVANCPDERQAHQIIKRFFGDNPVIGAYNSGFDIKMLKNMFQRCGDEFVVGLEIDILKIARDIFCEQKMKDHKLATIANTYGVDKGIQFHDAKDDVTVLVRVINAMIKDINENGVSDGLERVRVYRINYYPGYRGNSRIYIPTSKGVLFYDFKSQRWAAKDDKIDISSIDMQDVETQIFSMSGCDDYKELKKKCDTGAYSYKKSEP